MSQDVEKLKCRIAPVPLSLVEQLDSRLLKCEKVNNDRQRDRHGTPSDTESSLHIKLSCH
jgi:hypothetical protein